MHQHLFIGGEHDHIVGHLADNVAEELGVQHDAARLMDLCLDGGADTRLHIVAREGQVHIAFHQNTFQRGDGALGGHGTGGGGHCLLQQRFFTGKFQHSLFLSFLKTSGIFLKTTAYTNLFIS